MNVSIHGIDEDVVRGAPCFPDVVPHTRELCEDRIVVHHLRFDRDASARATQRYGVLGLCATWLESARVARRTWDEFSRRGYGLKNLATELDVPLVHHDALSDAIAAGTVFDLAMTHSGLGPEEWLERAGRPLSEPLGGRTGDPTGHLWGERIVFTGALAMPRRQAAELAATAGADVAGSVSRKTTIVVVGLQDLQRTGGQAKSSKHRKADSLIGEGIEISIIGEDDFLELVQEEKLP